MTKRQFDGILIDFYGTICAGDREAVEAVCRCIVDTCRLPLDAEEFAVKWGERFFEIVESSNHESFRTLRECELVSLRETLAAFGRSADPAPFIAELDKYWNDPPIYNDALDFLKHVELPICCVSNADTKPLMNAIEKHDLRFDAVVTSEDARCYKPDTTIFKRALAALGIDASRAVHVGDSLHSDVGGASDAGIATVWVRRENRIHDIGTGTPDCTIASLAELLGVLFGRDAPHIGPP